MPVATEQNGNLFRFVILAILIIIFITIASIRIWELRIAAERIGVAHTLGTLRSALGITLSEIVVKEGAKSLGRLHQSNPMDLLTSRDEAVSDLEIKSGTLPVNYLGEFSTENAPTEEGAWYFDTDTHLLIYRIRFNEHIDIQAVDETQLLKFKIDVKFTDLNHNRTFDPAIEQVKSINLISLYPYQWNDTATLME